MFTASAWPDQVLSGAGRRDREGQVLEEEQVRRELAPQFPLEGVIGPGLMERRQELGDGDAADAGAIEADRAVPHDLLEGGGLEIHVTIEQL